VWRKSSAKSSLKKIRDLYDSDASTHKKKIENESPPKLISILSKQKEILSKKSKFSEIKKDISIQDQSSQNKL